MPSKVRGKCPESLEADTPSSRLAASRMGRQCVGQTVILAALLLQAIGAPSIEMARFPAPEAQQGVAASGSFVYAIDNSAIGKYDPATGKRVARWRGDPRRFKHLNSCAIVEATLVCAGSNYPEVPMTSSVETFDAETLRHISTRSLGRGRGSLTWLDWHEGSWWACFAHYDGKGGEPGRDHRSTTLVRFSPDFAEQQAWSFPEAVLRRMAPGSSSGGAWNKDGLLYVTGHDRPELYALRLPAQDSRLELVAIIPTVTGGQGIDWAPSQPRILWSIDRKASQIVASRIPVIDAKP